MKYVFVALGLTAGNIFYQCAFVAEPVIRLAADRSFFQIIAVITCALVASK